MESEGTFRLMLPARHYTKSASTIFSEEKNTMELVTHFSFKVMLVQAYTQERFSKAESQEINFLILDKKHLQMAFPRIHIQD